MTAKAILALFLLAAAQSQAMANDCSADAIRQELHERADADQEARKAFIANPESRSANEHAVSVDNANTAWLASVVEKCHWPKKSEVGNEAAKDAWLLAQHADMNPEFQVIAAREMMYAVIAGEASGELLANLVDRNRTMTNLPQVYGKSYRVRPDGKIEFLDIVNPDQLDVRRQKVGLAPFFCYAKKASEQNSNAEIVWPTGVPLSFSSCSDEDK